MGALKKFIDIYLKNKELVAESMDFESPEISCKENEIYLKRMALDICANFVARAVGQSVFKTENKAWYYKLNVRPNTDQSASQFWDRVTYKLIVDNKVLVVLTDSDDLVIADTWNRNEYAVYEDTFEGVTVKGYTFKKTFSMSDVLYVEYNNERLERFTDGLFKDYGELYGRLLDAAKRNNQIRGTVSLDGTADLGDETQKKLQNYIDKLFRAFQNRSIAIAPITKGFTYNEQSNTTGTKNIQVEEIQKIPDFLINIVADAIGIPTALLHGNRAELKDNITFFNKYCLPPVLKKIGDELNAKTISPRDYEKGERIEVWGISRPGMFDVAEEIDKLISSGTFNPNEVRNELGYDPREGGDIYSRTKNYEDAKAQKGGEEE